MYILDYHYYWIIITDAVTCKQHFNVAAWSKVN